MKSFYRFTAVIVFTLILSGAVFMPNYAQAVTDHTEKPQFLYTISATSGSLQNNKLTLDGVPLVVYFSDRPDRLAGHISLQDFGTLWNEGEDSFAKDPPNAQLSILGQNPENGAVMIISDIEISETSVSFSAKILEGTVPGTFGQATLFLDGDYPDCAQVVNAKCTD